MSIGNARLLLTYLKLSPVTYTLYDFINYTLEQLPKNPTELLGYSKKELKAYSQYYFKEIIHPDDFPEVQKNLDRIKNCACDDHIVNRFRMRHKEGFYVWLQSFYKVLEVEDGKATKVAAATEDITEQIILENQLKKATDKLNELSYRDSHLLRAPVANIIGLVDIIEKDGLVNDTNAIVIHHLKKTVNKLDEIIRNITNNPENR
ncbi:MAG: PAS domain-containing protein [Cyclobacteriaceae bacterium]